MPQEPPKLPGTAISLPLLALALLAFALLPDRYPASGFLWDWLDGLGFGALAIVVFLGWDSQSPASHPRLRLHSHLATAGCLLAGAHAVGFLLADPLLLEYLKLKAPPSMLAGLAAALAMLALTISSYPTLRRRCYSTFKQFRSWHRWAGIVLLALSLWHTVGAGYSVGPGPGSRQTGITRLVLLLPLVVLLPLAAFWQRRRTRPLAIGPPPADSVAADRDAAIVLLMLVLLSLAWAAVKNP